ncbi:glutathione S-transferase alpha-4-like [Peromyscus eremicus]|uniref:glutathione S-transferase alpha-4-like n=1 Tax=Peromyscus eremicus TaxID=42410 RepID=UPI0027DEA0B1|nr:glutathione S-transferase alpha-4-like [Peromyscus eremicus]
MEAKPQLYYFCGRGRMESIRRLLAAAGMEFEEEFLETREQYEKLQKDGCLLFDQVPLVEMDGMLLTQSRAIFSYLAVKYNLYGKDLKERARIDMYTDDTLDLMIMITSAPFKPPEEKEENYALIVKRAETRYFPVFEKILKDHREAFLVGNQLSWADIQLLEAIFFFFWPMTPGNKLVLELLGTSLSSFGGSKDGIPGRHSNDSETVLLQADRSLLASAVAK